MASVADGGFVIAWESYIGDGFTTGVFAKRFSSAGTPLVDEFQVNTHTVNYFSFPVLSADADGDFVVTWNSQLGAFHGRCTLRSLRPPVLQRRRAAGQ